MIQYLIEISIYVIFALILSSFARKSEQDDFRLIGSEGCEGALCHPWNKYLTWYVVFFTVVAAIRWNVGSDCMAYSVIFERGIIRDGSTEYIFDWAVRLVHNIGLKGAFGLGIMAFVQILFITKALQKYKYILVLLPFVLFGGRYWQDLMGACRQMMVAAIFLWSIKFIIKRKAIWYFAIVAVAYYIHHSALLLVPLYFLPPNLRILDRRWILSIVLISCCIVGMTPSFHGFADSVHDLSDFLGYDAYTEKVTDILTSSSSEEALSFGPMMLTYILIPLFIIWSGPYLEKRFAESIPEFYLWYNIALLYSCLYFLLCNLSHLFIRPLLYFSLEQMVMAALLLKFLIDRYRINLRWQLACFFFCAVIAMNTAWDVYKAVGIPWDTTTYKIVFFH